MHPTMTPDLIVSARQARKGLASALAAKKLADVHAIERHLRKLRADALEREAEADEARRFYRCEATRTPHRWSEEEAA